MSLVIAPYETKWSSEFESFRNQVLSEGNDSLVSSKLNPEKLNGQLLLCFYNQELISISACEASCYTGDPEIAARVCRYHVLKSARPLFLYCGFQMLRQHCIWADMNNFKVVYFTHDVDNKSLNSLYQKKKKYGLGASNRWFEDSYFRSFELDKEMLFQVSKKSPLLQYVYVRKPDPNYQWRPYQNMVPMTQQLLENAQ